MEKIKQNIRGIVGVNLTNKEMDHMYEVFMDSRAYSYKAVNKYNIPYAMIRYQEAISIYRTFLFDSPMSEIVKDRINCNSKYFEIPDKEIVKREADSITLASILQSIKGKNTSNIYTW